MPVIPKLSDLLKNFAVTLKAHGASAFMSIWAICVALVGIFGSEHHGTMALGVLMLVGIFAVGSLIRRNDKDDS